MINTDRPFLGRGWGFPPTFDGTTHEVGMVDEEQDIRESLFILLSTLRGERVMVPEYGAGLQEQVFDRADTTTLTYLKGQVAEAILFFEPRIRTEAIVIDAGHHLDGRILIELSYQIKSTNSRSNMVFPFYAREGTDIRLP
jgi:phage baseplate assembly protein W